MASAQSGCHERILVLILSGRDAIDLPSLAEICRNERIASPGRTPIGFRL